MEHNVYQNSNAKSINITPRQNPRLYCCEAYNINVTKKENVVLNIGKKGHNADYTFNKWKIVLEQESLDTSAQLHKYASLWSINSLSINPGDDCSKQ